MAPKNTEKYRQAGLIAQNAMTYVISLLHQGIGDRTIGEVCRLGDAFIAEQASACFKSVAEKGVSRPVEICKNDFVSGVAPEESDRFQGGVVNDGDVLKVTLGVHIDGYSVLFGHTVIVSEQAVAEPFTGPHADAVIGSFLATEAVVALLSSVLSENHPLHGVQVTGATIRQVVEEIARTFDLIVVPGSRVRRIKRFVAGQVTVRDALPVVEWRPHSEEDERQLVEDLDARFEATPGHTYCVDVQMAPAGGEHGFVKLVDVPHIGSAVEGPSVYSRDFTVTYAPRTSASRQLVTAIDKHLSVFPFKLSHLAARSTLSMNQLRLGVAECVQRHILVGEPRQRAVFCVASRPKDQRSVVVAREIATVSLIKGEDSLSGFPEVLRLSGGRAFPPSWTHSDYAVGAGLAADALNARLAVHVGVKYVELKSTPRAQLELPPVGAADDAADAEMDVEV